LRQFSIVIASLEHTSRRRAEVDKLTKALDPTVIDRTDQIGADAEAGRLLSGRVPVVAFVNNHFAGYAPATVAELLKALA
jgi:hypothetical protein